jgi:hypothetical protein
MENPIEKRNGFSFEEYQNLLENVEFYVPNAFRFCVEKQTMQENKVYYCNCFKTEDLANKELLRRLEVMKRSIEREIKQEQNIIKQLSNDLDIIIKNIKHFEYGTFN